MNPELPLSEFIVSSFIPGLILWLFGFFCGVLFKHIIDRFTREKDNSKLINHIVLFVIIFAWLLSNVIDWLDPNYATPLALHVLMASPVGFYFSPIDLSKFLKK